MTVTMLDTDILLKYHSPPPETPSLQCFYSLHTDKATIESSIEDPLFGDPYSILSHLKLAHPDPSSSTTHLLLSHSNPDYNRRRQLEGSTSFEDLFAYNFSENQSKGFSPRMWILVSTTPIYIGPTEESSLLEVFSTSTPPKRLLLPSGFPTHYINKSWRPRLNPPFHVHSNKELSFHVVSTSASNAARALTITKNLALSIARLRLLHCDIPSSLFANFLNLSYSASTIEPPSSSHWTPRPYETKSKYDGGFPVCDFQSLFLQRDQIHPRILTRRRLRPNYLGRLLALRPWLPYLDHLDRNQGLDSPSSSWAKAYNPRGYSLPTDLHKRTTCYAHFAYKMRNLASASSGPKSTGNSQYTSKARLLATYIATELMATLRLYKSLKQNHPLRTLASLHLPPISPLSLDLYLPPHLHSPSNVFPCPTTPPESQTK